MIPSRKDYPASLTVMGLAWRALQALSQVMSPVGGLHACTAQHGACSGRTKWLVVT